MRGHAWAEALAEPFRQSQMLDPIRNLFRSRRSEPRRAYVPAGERYYVIGDIHGRRDLFADLIGAVEADDAAAAPAQTSMILLGDLVDRGPDSAGVIRLARDWQRRRKVRILAGNHEEMFLEAFDDLEMLRHFVKHGGRETILSYDIERARYNRLTLEELQMEMRRVVPAEDRAFLSGFEDMIVAGEYCFVHAGIDPSVPLEEQKRSDMLWIRERFLRHTEPLSHVVVHGHTIFEAVEHREHRIGIDTGAFRTGRLTALVLEGDRRRTIQAVEAEGAIAIERAEL